MLRKLLVGSSAALVLAMSAVAQAAEETQFYSNIKLGTPTFPTYYAEGDTEFADDVPFSGSHLVSSFTFGYQSPAPVHATFRFYGVNPATELLGEQVAQIERDLPATDAATPTVTLSEAEQFWWTAESNVYPGEHLGSVPTGGWYGIQFSAADGGFPEARFRLATGTSSSGMLNVETGVIISALDPSGTTPSSMYLQVRDVGSTGEVQPALINLVVSPTTVKAGNSPGSEQRRAGGRHDGHAHLQQPEGRQRPVSHRDSGRGFQHHGQCHDGEAGPQHGDRHLHRDGERHQRQRPTDRHAVVAARRQERTEDGRTVSGPARLPAQRGPGPRRSRSRRAPGRSRVLARC